MKLIKIIEKNEVIKKEFGIYELETDAELKVSGGKKFVLKQGLFSDEDLIPGRSEKYLVGIDPFRYECFHETLQEARLTCKIIELQSRLEKVTDKVEDIMSLVSTNYYYETEMIKLDKKEECTNEQI